MAPGRLPASAIATQAKSRTAICHMKLASLRATSAGILLVTIALTGVQAQTQPAPRMVTRDELRVCMNSETDVMARRQATTARTQQDRDEAAAIRAEAQELAQEQKRLEEDQKPMDRFGRKVKAHNERVKAAQAGADAFRAELDAVNKALVAYNDQCGGISYLPEDKAAILKERAAGKQ